MQKYTVHLDKNNYFSVDSKIIEFKEETVRIVNLRSINGFIGENFNLSDTKLKDIIMKYLRFSNNVELLNIYSRKYNHYNWLQHYYHFCLTRLNHLSQRKIPFYPNLIHKLALLIKLSL